MGNRLTQDGTVKRKCVRSESLSDPMIAQVKGVRRSRVFICRCLLLGVPQGHTAVTRCRAPSGLGFSYPYLRSGRLQQSTCPLVVVNTPVYVSKEMNGEKLSG
jgi:hypothetical protein